MKLEKRLLLAQPIIFSPFGWFEPNDSIRIKQNPNNLGHFVGKNAQFTEGRPRPFKKRSEFH